MFGLYSSSLFILSSLHTGDAFDVCSASGRMHARTISDLYALEPKGVKKELKPPISCQRLNLSFNCFALLKKAVNGFLIFTYFTHAIYSSSCCIRVVYAFKSDTVPSILRFCCSLTGICDSMPSLLAALTPVLIRHHSSIGLF